MCWTKMLRNPVKQKFHIFCRVKEISLNRVGLFWETGFSQKGVFFIMAQKPVIYFPQGRKKGVWICRMAKKKSAFHLCALNQFWNGYQSAAVHGGLDANRENTRNPSRLARAQQRGVCLILTLCLKSLTARPKKNEVEYHPGSAPVTTRNVPEAAILSRPGPAGRVRGP